MEKIPGQCRDLVRFLIERKMARFENVDLCIRYIQSIGLGLSYPERRIIFSPYDERCGMVLPEPSLPCRIARDVGPIVVEEVALNIGFA